VKKMRAAPDGPSEYYVQDLGEHEVALRRHVCGDDQAAPGGCRRGEERHRDHSHGWWLDLVLEEVGDASVAETILLIGDGLYSYAALPGELDRPEAGGGMDGLLKQVRVLKAAVGR
jgi:hypothetical protein